MEPANRVGLRTISVHLVCFSLFLNLSGADPVDYLIVGSLILHIAPITRVILSIPRNLDILFFGCAFLFSYVFSAFFGGFNSSFVSNLVINLCLLLILVSHCTSLARFRRVVLSLSLGFGLSVLLASFQAFDLLSPFPGQFEVVRSSRFMGLFGDPNLLGSSSVFLCLYWLDVMVHRGTRPVSFLVLSGLLFLASFLTLLFTQSRSAWGGLVLAMLAYFLILMRGFRFRRALRKFLIFLFVLGCSLIILQEFGAAELIQNRLFSSKELDSEAEAERFGLVYTAMALRVAANSPLGVGPGNTAAATGFSNQDGDPIGSHNAFVQVAAENGWVAGFSFLYLVCYLLFMAFKNSMYSVSGLGRPYRVMFASLLSLVFCGFFQDLIQWKVAWVVPALIVAMLVHSRRSPMHW